MSSRVFTHLFRVSLSFRIFYSSQRLHMEVNTSHNYHNINNPDVSQHRVNGTYKASQKISLK
jgi:hypothetical protein